MPIRDDSAPYWLSDKKWQNLRTVYVNVDRAVTLLYREGPLGVIYRRFNNSNSSI